MDDTIRHNRRYLEPNSCICSIYRMGIYEERREMFSFKLEKSLIKGNSSIRTFLRQLSILFGCRSIGIIIGIFITLLNGRVLTVEDMGQFNLAINLSNVLVIPLVFGTNTSVLKILPETRENQKGTVIGTVFLCNGLMCILGGILFCSFSFWGSGLLKISSMSWYLAVIIAIASNLCIVTETFLKHQQDFKNIGLGKLISSIVLLLAYLIGVYYLKLVDVKLFLVFNVISQLILFLILVVKVDFHQIHFSLKVAKDIYSLSVLYMLSWLLSTFLYNADIYILAYLSDHYEVGVYSAYQVNVRNYFSIFYHDVFAAVFLPTILSMKIKKDEIYRNVNKWIPAIFGIIVMGTAAVCSLFIISYGKQYELNFLYVALVALGIGFQSIFFLINSILVIEGMEGAKLSLAIMSKPFPFLVANIFLLTYLFGKIGTLIAFPVNQLILVILLLYKTRRYREGDTNGC